MLNGVVDLGRDGHEDGLGGVLEQRRPVLSLSLLHPVAVDLEGARIDELADGLDGVRVALEHLLGDGFGTSVVAVDPHGGQDSHADDLLKSWKVKMKFLQLKRRVNTYFAQTFSYHFKIIFMEIFTWQIKSPFWGARLFSSF